MEKFLRLIYIMAVYISTPLILLYLAWRGWRNPAYFKRWLERLGWVKLQMPSGGIWVHAVSVGEVNGVLPLVQRLQARWPMKPIIFTCSTPTGSERIKAIFPNAVVPGGHESAGRAQLYHCYLPLDLPGAMKRLYRQIRPSLVVVMETEIWPNFFLTAKDLSIPLVLVNARLSPRSASGYRRYLPQAPLALNATAAIIAQTHADAERFVQAGASSEKVFYSGNLKGDLQLPDGLFQRAQSLPDCWGRSRRVWMGASTHEGEEQVLLEAHAQLLQEYPDTLLILVPRHPERFDRVWSLVLQQGFRAARHSSLGSENRGAQVLVVDAMGILLEYAAVAQLIFVGGSLVPIGGHNPLEPAALQKPVLMGPHHENIKDLMDLLTEAGGACIVDTAEKIGPLVAHLFKQPEQMEKMGLQALSVVKAQRGAVERTLDYIQPLVK